jgi:hypothetical protein
VDGDGLAAMIAELDAEDLVEDYTGAPRTAAGDVKSRATPSGSTPSGTNETTGPSSTETNYLAKVENLREWHRLTIGSIVLAFVLLLVGGALMNSGIGVLESIGGIVSLGWFVAAFSVPLFFYLDIRYVRRHSSWNPTTWKYMLGLLFVWFVTIPVYFYRRHRALGLW